MKKHDLVSCAVFTCLVALAGCSSGIKFTNATVYQEPLPQDYGNRDFVEGLAALRNNPSRVTGWLIIKVDTPRGANYQCIKRFVIGNVYPEVVPIKDPPLYSNKMTTSAKFNGSYAIAHLSVADNSAYEIVITDMAFSVLDDSLMMIDSIKSFGNKLPDSLKNKIFYVLSVKSTCINHRLFTSIEANADVDGGDVFGAKTGVFHASENFTNDYTVSVDLIPLKNILMDTYKAAGGIRFFANVIRRTGSLVKIDTLSEMSPDAMIALGLKRK